MTARFNAAQIQHLKDVAKRAARMRRIPHHAALDEVAVSHGFKTWQLLVRGSVALLTDHGFKTPAFTLDRDHDAWRAALRKVEGANVRQPSSYPGLRDVCAAFATPIVAVQFAQAYIAQLLNRPRFQVRSGSQVRAEMRWWLPYCVHEVEDGMDTRLLLNRHYKPVGSINPDHAKYGNFSNLHVSFGLHALRSFSLKNEGSGSLFDDGTAPWFSRDDAEAYLDRLNALEAVCRNPVANDKIWRREHQVIYETLTPWARIPTWFTAHGHDERRLAEVVSKMQRWQHPPTEDQLRVALSQHREENPELLGGKASELHVERFAQRICGMLITHQS